MFDRRDDTVRSLNHWATEIEARHKNDGSYPAPRPIELGAFVGDAPKWMLELGTVPSAEWVIDPFTNAPIIYHTNGEGYILLAAGADKVYSINPQEVLNGITTPMELLNMTYDPSNGTPSAGDIFRWSGQAKP